MLKIGDLTGDAVCADMIARPGGRAGGAAGTRSGLLMVLILFCACAQGKGSSAGLAVLEHSSAAMRTQASLALGMPNYVVLAQRGPARVRARHADLNAHAEETAGE
jgi:hypothetical protein